MYNYPGNIHIHTRYSDGSGDFEQIASDAAAAGLSYVIIADHETLAGLPEEGIHSGVVMLVGIELNRRHSHYLALGIDHPVEADEDNPQNVIDRVRAMGGLGFIAHPFEKGAPYIEKGKAYPWKTWPVFGFDGLELWNYTSHWRGRHPSVLKTLYYFLLNRRAAMDSPPRELLSLWDCYTSAGHRVTAIGSSDAHAFIYRLGFLKVRIFTYRYIFSTINTYVLLEEQLSRVHHRAKEQITGALRDGRCYLCFDSLHPGRDFYYYAETPGGRVEMGSEVAFRKEVVLRAGVRAPASRFLTRLIGSGRPVAAAQGRELACSPSGPGVYRVEVLYRSRFGRLRPWIYSNPIYLTGSSA